MDVGRGSACVRAHRSGTSVRPATAPSGWCVRGRHSLILRHALVRSGGLLDVCSLPVFSVWSNLPGPLRGVHAAVDTRSLGATGAGVHLLVIDASSTSTAVTLRRGEMG